MASDDTGDETYPGVPLQTIQRKRSQTVLFVNRCQVYNYVLFFKWKLSFISLPLFVNEHNIYLKSVLHGPSNKFVVSKELVWESIKLPLFSVWFRFCLVYQFSWWSHQHVSSRVSSQWEARLGPENQTYLFLHRPPRLTSEQCLCPHRKMAASVDHF